MVRRARGADHTRAACHRELDTGAADTPGGATDEQCVAARDAELVERSGRRLDGRRQRSSGDEVERRRDRRVEGQHNPLGLRRRVGGQAEHAVTDRDIGDALAELVDHAGRLVSQGLWELLVHQSVALLPIARVDAGGADRDPHLAGTRMRVGQLDDLEHFRAAEPAEADCLHRSLRSLPGRAVDTGHSVPPTPSGRGCAMVGPGYAARRCGGDGVVEDLVDPRRSEPAFVQSERDMLEAGWSSTARRWCSSAKASTTRDARRGRWPRRCSRCTGWSGTWPRSSATGSDACSPSRSAAFWFTQRRRQRARPARRRGLGADLAAWQAECERADRSRPTTRLDDTGLRRGQPCSLRWIYVHMIEEYARHNGHADLIRELVDGAVGW